ncbi:unnamed protein product, partial [Tetraodon nigroviridis]
KILTGNNHSVQNFGWDNVNIEHRARCWLCTCRRAELWPSPPPRYHLSLRLQAVPVCILAKSSSRVQGAKWRRVQSPSPPPKLSQELGTRPPGLIAFVMANYKRYKGKIN